MPENKELIVISKWIEGPFRLSHHPMCTPFNGHTLRIFNSDVCRGCLFWYPGILTGLIAGLLLGWYAMNKYALAILMFALIVPTLFQLIFSLPRLVKDVARFLLGISTGLTFLVGIFPGHPDLLVRAIVIIVFAIVFVPLTIFRNSRNEEICLNCSERPQRDDLRCSGYKFQRERAAIASTQLSLGISDINEIPIDVKSFDDI